MPKKCLTKYHLTDVATYGENKSFTSTSGETDTDNNIIIHDGT